MKWLFNYDIRVMSNKMSWVGISLSEFQKIIHVSCSFQNLFIFLQSIACLLVLDKNKIWIILNTRIEENVGGSNFSECKAQNIKILNFLHFNGWTCTEN